MAPKEPMYNKIFPFVCLLILLGCEENENLNKNRTSQILWKNLDTSRVPFDTVFKIDTSLELYNGVYLYHGKPFSGYIKDKFENNTTKSIGSYLTGKKYGLTKTYFSDGQLKTERNYNNGKAYGKHIGYWNNGNIEFEFTYYFDKREGVQKQWYESGSPYFELNFQDDKENGMQKAWRENGKLYINYEVKDGKRYGLQKSGLCYTLKDQKLK